MARDRRPVACERCGLLAFAVLEGAYVGSPGRYWVGTTGITAFTGLGSHARRRGQPGNIASYPTVRTAATLPVYP